MIILTIRTDKPEAEIGLFEGQKKLNYVVWQADRELAETIHTKIEELFAAAPEYLTSQVSSDGLNQPGKKLELKDIQGIVVFGGPGSFTGLRIGITVANTLAYTQKIPIIASVDEDWLEQGINDLLSGKNQKIVTPEYGAQAKTTTPRK